MQDEQYGTVRYGGTAIRPIGFLIRATKKRSEISGENKTKRGTKMEWCMHVSGVVCKFVSEPPTSLFFVGHKKPPKTTTKSNYYVERGGGGRVFTSQPDGQLTAKGDDG